MSTSLPSFLNEHAPDALALAGAVTLQSTILVALLLLLDLGLRQRVRAALRYGLWLLVILKLLSPPSLLSPTGIAYWLVPRFIAPPAPPRVAEWQVRIPSATEAPVPGETPPQMVMPPQRNFFVGLWLLWISGTVGLGLGVGRGHWRIARRVRGSMPASPRLQSLLRQTARELGLNRVPDLRISPEPLSPAVCGFWRPVVLLPGDLELSDAAWRTVFLHELIHLRRRDLWVNAVQVFTQILWWWNPLVWWTNARIRQLRETAVDEAVMLATEREDSEYPATLVALARHCLAQPAFSLGLLGILAVPSRLERRVRRLLEMPLPHTAKLGWSGWLVLGLFAAGLVPMGFEARGTAGPAPAAAAPPIAEVRPPVKPESPGVVTTDSNPAAPTVGAPTDRLSTRSYKLSAPVELKLLGVTAESEVPKSPDLMQQQLRRFISAQSVNFPAFDGGASSDPNRASVFMNRNDHVLLVRATPSQLDRLGEWIQMLGADGQTFGVTVRLGPGREQRPQQPSAVPQQIQIEAKFIEGDRGGIERLLLPRNDARAANDEPLRLSEAEARQFLHEAESLPGFEVLATPKVTTLSGRAAEVQVAEMRTIVVGESNAPSGKVFLTEQVATGPKLAVTVVTDPSSANALRLTATASMVEFLGYAEATKVHPLIRSNSASMDVRLVDGESMLLGLPLVTNTVQFVDKVVVLGDLPLIGRLFRSNSTSTVVRRVLVLVTPRLVDPAGQRVNPPKRP